MTTFDREIEALRAKRDRAVTRPEVERLVGTGGGGVADWASITGKPSTFTPSPHVHGSSEITDFASAVAALITGKANTVHTHVPADITGLNESIQDMLGTFLVAGSNITLTYDDVANTLTIASTGGGGGGAPQALPWVI